MTTSRTAIALAGGGPLGAIYELGTLVALEEALIGFELTNCDHYVGVSSGAFLAAGLANGLTARDMYQKFVATEHADDPFEPEVLLRPALGEYGRRLASLPHLTLKACRKYFSSPRSRGFFESFQELTQAIPTGLLDNGRIGEYLINLFDAPGRTNDFRKLRKKLCLVATDLDTGKAVPFGAPGWDDIPISVAVQASSALPGLFPPVEIRKRHYVDGALVKTLHASVALEQGAKLLIGVNPLVPFDAVLARKRSLRDPIALVEAGLPVVLAQTFRSIIHSRLHAAMQRYKSDFPEADVVLFEPSRGDAEMFFTNVFSYADRDRLSEHAYQRTRAQLLRRQRELQPILERHGIGINLNVLREKSRSLRPQTKTGLGGSLKSTTARLGNALSRLEQLLSSDTTFQPRFDWHCEKGHLSTPTRSSKRTRAAPRSTGARRHAR